MPELPDVTVYLEALETRIKDTTLNRVRVSGPFLLRTVDPPVSAAVEGGRVVGAATRRQTHRNRRFEGYSIWLAIHLMIAGRLHWREAGKAKGGGKQFLAAFEFPHGTLTPLTWKRGPNAAHHCM